MTISSADGAAIPRPEYPRPQFRRSDWLCLNGVWQFEIDRGDSGLERGLKDRQLFGNITVPFCPESQLSGIGDLDFHNAVWYRRDVAIPDEWAGREVILHFQAVDYDSTVWVNGIEVARHRGGWTGFSASLKGVAEPGSTATIVLRARDDARKPMASGKQSKQYHNAGCHYPRTTGIWQTVWMEPVSPVHLGRARITPNVSGSRFHVVQPIVGFGESRTGLQVRAILKSGAETIDVATAPADIDLAPLLELSVVAEHRRLWDPQDPFLYGLEIQLLALDGTILDQVESYAGLRSIAIDGKAVLINGKPIFQRLVLDQGFYEDGILTAPTDAALIQDITLSLEAGFNGARLHQKVFEERFLYHADRLGYLVWGEFGDWGIDKEQPGATEVAQWLEALHRDYCHPSIIGWCGLNETWQPITDNAAALSDLTAAVFLAAKAIDPTRPVLDASGYSHRVTDTDIYDCHDYDQKPDTFTARHANTIDNNVYQNRGGKGETWSTPYRGQPFFVSEFGGAWWNPDASPDDPSWGYGERPRTIEEFYDRFDRLCTALLDNPAMFGYCYTQLTDVYQEQNGIYHFDRRAKFDMARIAAVQQRTAAIERKAQLK